MGRVEQKHTYIAMMEICLPQQAPLQSMAKQSKASQSTYEYSEEMTIEKDGTFTLSMVNDGDKEEYTGNWWWLSDKKNKTRIALGDDYESFEIDQLKNKELILTSETSYKNVDEDGYSYEERSTTTMTFTKK
jgi:hypothetical protein